MGGAGSVARQMLLFSLFSTVYTAAPAPPARRTAAGQYGLRPHRQFGCAADSPRLITTRLITTEPGHQNNSSSANALQHAPCNTRLETRD